MSKPSFVSRFSASKTGGFTLIELLVVIGIIGILSAVVLASLTSARAKGRDARRISDIKQLQLALELYYDACSTYPTSLTNATVGCGTNNSGGGLVSNGYISQMVTDPSTNANYVYASLIGASGIATTCASYHLGAALETSSNTVLTNDFDTTVGGTYAQGTATPDGTVCTGNAVADFAGASLACTTTVGTDSCYDVRP